MSLSQEEIKQLGETVKKDNRRTMIRKFSLAIFIFITVILIAKWVKGDYKFLFHETQFTEGVVIDNRIDNQGYFKDQNVLYEYYVDGVRYTGIAYELMKQRRNGEILTIEYAMDDPEVHEAIWQ